MIDRSLFSICLLLLLGFCPCFDSRSGAAETAPVAPSFEIAAPAAWVRLFEPEAAAAAESDGNGIAYLLVDQQENVEPRSLYYHEAYRITSDYGVQNRSEVTVNFDPSYQKLIVHHIRLTRGGMTVDRLERSKVKLLQREKEMESFLYDGSFTAQYQLDDVRVDDVIEYAYTIEGANPVLQGKYFSTLYLEWFAPVHQAVERVLRPASRELYFTSKNQRIEPKITRQGETIEWIWEGKDIRARKADDNTPLGYNPYGHVQVSEFANWKGVVDWAAPLYVVSSAPSPELEQEVARLRALPSAEDRILAALRFVQEEIRYLGIESGVGSHRPTAPAEVMRRRFGDCKDKTLLLATLLRHCEIKATPALVSSGLRSRIKERWPSPAGFDHVIIQVVQGRDTWWLDATRAGQRGPLEQIYTTSFGYALVLSEGNTALTTCSPPLAALPKKEVNETYHIELPDRESQLTVVTDYGGASADAVRRSFKVTTKQDLEKEYLRFYARQFPRIRGAEPVQYDEIPGSNGCRVTERYAIPGIWQLSEDKSHYQVILHAADVENAMGTPGAVKRTDPLAIAHPVNITQKIHAQMFQDWPLESPVNRKISNAFFRYQKSVEARGRNVELSYFYETMTEQVPVPKVAEYDGALREIQDRQSLILTYRTPEQLAAGGQAKGGGGGQFNWPIAIMLCAILVAVIPAVIRFYRSCRRESPRPPSLHHPRLEGLSGWLWLVGLSAVVQPFSFMRGLYMDCGPIFHIETWRALTTVGQPAYHELWMPMMLFELIYNLLGLIWSTLLFVLFFQKRAAWPYCFVALYAYVLLGGAIDVGLGMQIPAVSAQLGNSAQPVMKGFLGALIWIPYALKSKTR